MVGPRRTPGLSLGRLKIVSKKGKGWELYDLGEDRTERKDLASSKQGKVKQLADKWEKTVDGFEGI